MIPELRFDGAAHWATLSPEQQADIGALALELVAAWDCLVCTTGELKVTPYVRAAQESVDQIDHQLCEAVDAALADRRRKDGTPPFPSRLGNLCRICGGSEHELIPGVPSWATPILCTECAEKAS